MEITLGGAIIWKALATFIFILIATGVIKRIFKLKMVHWILSVVGISALILALNIGLIEKTAAAFKKKEIRTEYVSVEKNLDQDSFERLTEFRLENEKLKHDIHEIIDNSTKTANDGSEEEITDPRGRVYRKTFDVPPGDNQTEKWLIPYNADGWNWKITWEGKPVWYPAENDPNYIIPMNKGEKINLGNWNSDLLNFSFKSSDTLPAKVVLEYWSK